MKYEENSKDTLAARKMNKGVLEQMKPETLPEAKITKPKLSSFEYITRKQGSLEKMIMMGKIEGSGKRPNRRWIDFIKEALGMSLQELSRAAEDRTLWTSLTRGFPRVRADQQHITHTKKSGVGGSQSI